jgi:hypothetical protein
MECGDVPNRKQLRPSAFIVRKVDKVNGHRDVVATKVDKVDGC